jgi:hypothetical protein
MEAFPVMQRTAGSIRLLWITLKRISNALRRIPNKIFKVENEYYIEEKQDEYYLVWINDNAGPDSLSFKRLLKAHKYILLASHPEGKIYYHPVPGKSQQTQ